METKCHDYMEYIFYRNPSIEDILLPYNKKINKYAFLIKTAPIISFINRARFKYPFSIVCVAYNLEKVFNNKLSYDNDMMQLYNSINDQLIELQ